MARILVIDDYEDLLSMVRAVLEAEGHEVATAADGAEGWEMAVKLRPDLVLLDTELPGLGGLAVCRKLKADDALRRVPVLMMTGRPSADAKERAVLAGASMLLLKPFPMGTLLAGIAGALGKAVLPTPENASGII